MSAPQTHGHGAGDGHGEAGHGHGSDPGHGHADGHGDGHGDGHEHAQGPHATLGGYAVGFGLSVLLTAIPFWLVMGKVVDSTAMLTLILLAFAGVQIVVHMIYFLHVDAKAQGGWNLLSLMFTVILVVIVLAGSSWVMFHLNQNMMPMSPEQMRNMP